MKEYFKVDTEGAFPDFFVMAKAFPKLSARLLGYIGKSLSLELYKKHLKGQEGITLYPRSHDTEGFPLDSNSRRMSSYSIKKGAKVVTVSSYPLNFFEKGRRLRSGRREPGKGILRSFRGQIPGKLSDLTARGAVRIIREWQEENG